MQSTTAVLEPAPDTPLSPHAYQAFHFSRHSGVAHTKRRCRHGAQEKICAPLFAPLRFSVLFVRVIPAPCAAHAMPSPSRSATPLCPPQRRDATLGGHCRPRRAPIASHSKRLLALVCLRRPGRPLRRVVRRGSQRPRTRSTRWSKARSLSTAASSLGLSSRGSPHWLVCRLEPPPPWLEAHHCPHTAVVSATVPSNSECLFDGSRRPAPSRRRRG